MVDYPRVDEIVAQLAERYPALDGSRASVAAAARLVIDAFASGRKLIVCGNGGSAADADHIVGELMKGFTLRRPLSPKTRERLAAVDPELGKALGESLQSALPAIALGRHAALETAFANDVEPRMAFAQELVGYGAAGDVFWGISTSGLSENVLLGAVTARALGLRTIGLTGADGGKLARLCDVNIAVPERVTYKAQELHLPVYHAICLAVEEALFA